MGDAGFGRWRNTRGHLDVVISYCSSLIDNWGMTVAWQGRAAGREEAPDGGNKHGYCTIEMRARFVGSDVFNLSLPI